MTQWKYRLIEWFICQRNYFDKGMSLLYYVKTIGQYFFMAGVTIKLWFPTFIVPIWLIVLSFIAMVSCGWIIGKLWDKYGIFIIENEWNNKRNSYQIEMRKKFNLKK